MLTTLRLATYNEKTRATASKTVCTQNLDRPAHRASQSDRLDYVAATDSGTVLDGERLAEANFARSGRSRYAP